jgi:hypothetical protein
LPWEISYEQVTSHFASFVIVLIQVLGDWNTWPMLIPVFFCTSTVSSQLLMGWFFCNFMCHLIYLGSYIFPRDSDYIHTFSSISFWAPTNSAVALWNELSWW